MADAGRDILRLNMMKFLADMGVAQRIVQWLRDEGHEAVHLKKVLEEAEHALEQGAIVVVEEGRHRIRRSPFGV